MSEETKKNKSKKARIILIITLFLICVIGLVYYFLWLPYQEWKNFKDLMNFEHYNKQEFIFQTISFSSFIPYTSNNIDGNLTNSDIWFVKGTADITFSNFTNLIRNDDATDYKTKTLRLDYTGPKEQYFKVNLIISEEDMYSVYNEHKKSAKEDVSEYAIIKEHVKENMKKEIESQILTDDNIKNAFLQQLTKMVQRDSDWKNVEIKFEEK